MLHFLRILRSASAGTYAWPSNLVSNTIHTQSLGKEPTLALKSYDQYSLYSRDLSDIFNHSGGFMF